MLMRIIYAQIEECRLRSDERWRLEEVLYALALTEMLGSSWMHTIPSVKTISPVSVLINACFNACFKRMDVGVLMTDDWLLQGRGKRWDATPCCNRGGEGKQRSDRHGQGYNNGDLGTRSCEYHGLMARDYAFLWCSRGSTDKFAGLFRSRLPF